MWETFTFSSVVTTNKLKTSTTAVADMISIKQAAHTQWGYTHKLISPSARFFLPKTMWKAYKIQLKNSLEIQWNKKFHIKIHYTILKYKQN